MEPKFVTSDEVKHELDAGKPVTFLDDRSDAAWNRSDIKIAGAIRVPPTEVEPHLAEIPHGHEIVTYCT